MTEQRRLAAILVADVVGYSKLIGSDEAGTLAQLQALRTEVIEPQIAKHAGRLFKSVGDGFLVEFASAVQAVSCARAIQDANGQGRLTLRIGIHVGDVVVQGDDLMGDGVNVAARIEGIAQPGGIALSRQAHDQVRDRLDIGFIDKGEVELKNIQRPVQVFVLEGAKFGRQATALPLPDEPSIIVLPFICPGGTLEQEAIADGITESLITDLSRHTGLAVVARTTAFALKGKAADVRKLTEQFGVRYVLEGSLQLGGRRARVNVQLISANDGIHVWADRFDKEIGDVLDLQDEIVERTSRAIVVQLRDAEIKRGTEATKTSLDAATLIQLGRRTFTQGASRRNSARAAELYAEAVRVDDENALAHALLSICKTVRFAYMWSDEPDAEFKEATRHCDRARTLDPGLPFAQVASAWLLFAERKFEPALAAFERIAETAPLAGGNAFSNLAVAKMNVGRAAEAEADLLRAIRVFPGDPQMDVWHFYLGLAYSHQGKNAEAAEAFRKSTSLNADLDAAHVCLAAICVQLGKMQDASASIRHAQELGTRWTIRTLKVAAFAGIGVGGDDARMNALWDGLRQAGLPE